MMEPLENSEETEGSDPAPQTIHVTESNPTESTGAPAPPDQGAVDKTPDPPGSKRRPKPMLDQGLLLPQAFSGPKVLNPELLPAQAFGERKPLGGPKHWIPMRRT